MTRLQKILSLILGLQIILAAILLWPRGATTAAGLPLFAGFEIEEAAAVTILSNSGEQLKMVRGEGGWRLASGGDYPVTDGAVETLLEKAAAITTSRLATRTGASHDRLQVADDNFVARVRFEDDAGATRTLYLGSSPNPRSTHVRLAGGDATYVTGELTSSDVSASAGRWIDTAFISLEQDEIVELILENDNGLFELEKSGEDEWELAGLTAEEPFEISHLNVLLSRAANMRLSAPLGTEEAPEYGLADPGAEVTLTAETEDGASETHTLQVGAFDEEANGYVVKWSGSPYYVRVSAFNVEEFLNTTRDDFIAEPEPEEEAPSDG